MINQARSLILNSKASDRPSLGTFGEEYVPEQYRVLEYPGTLRRVRDALLGTAGDPLYQNYRLAQLMCVMHSNQYSEEYALSLDPRYTYRPFDKQFMDFDFSVEVEKLNVTGMELAVMGEPRVDDSRGRATWRWIIRTAAGPRLDVKDVTTNRWTEYPIVVVDEEASPITLPGGITLQLAIPVGSWVDEAEWLVTSMARPTRDLGLMVDSINGLGAGTTADLLRGIPSSFRSLWYDGVSLVDQLGGLIGAFVYKAEETRQNV